MGEVKCLIFDPKNGDLVGLGVFSLHDRKNKIVPTTEVKGIGDGFLIIDGLNSLCEKEDVVKISLALEVDPQIIGSKVETESGQKLGRVNDATVELHFFSLAKLYVSPSFAIKSLAKELVIPAKKIIEIKKDKIIVSDEFARARAQGVAVIRPCE